MARSKLTVIIIVVLAVAAALAARLYVASGPDHGVLAGVDCDQLLPTVFELQGNRMEIGPNETCVMLRTIASLAPTGEGFDNRPSDPWHYYGRMRVLPKNDAWFLIFVARRSTGFRPQFSLQHRRGGGWAVIGQFDAERVLVQLGVFDRIDRSKLMSGESLAPTDQRQAL